eukprot:scaffold102178_cov69-Phaeocystis_antarctica.AAC.5
MLRESSPKNVRVCPASCAPHQRNIGGNNQHVTWMRAVRLRVVSSSGGKGGSLGPVDQPVQCRLHSFLRRGAGRDAIQPEDRERRQRAAVERSGQRVHPASVTWVKLRLSSLSFFSPPVVVGSAPAAAGGATRAAMPSSPNGLSLRLSCTSAGSRLKAGARATSAASPKAARLRERLSSRGRAPRPRAAASSEAPALPTCMPPMASLVTAGRAPAPSPSASRCTPSGPAAPEYSESCSTLSAGSTEPSPLAAPHPHLAAQCCGHLMINPQLLPQRRRQQYPQLVTGAAQVPGEARLERVAQLAEDDAVLVGAELRQRHRGARAAARGDNARQIENGSGLVRGIGPMRRNTYTRHTPSCGYYASTRHVFLSLEGDVELVDAHVVLLAGGDLAPPLVHRADIEQQRLHDDVPHRRLVLVELQPRHAAHEGDAGGLGEVDLADERAGRDGLAPARHARVGLDVVP